MPVEIFGARPPARSPRRARRGAIAAAGDVEGALRVVVEAQSPQCNRRGAMSPSGVPGPNPYFRRGETSSAPVWAKKRHDRPANWRRSRLAPAVAVQHPPY